MSTEATLPIAIEIGGSKIEGQAVLNLSGMKITPKPDDNRNRLLLQLVEEGVITGFIIKPIAAPAHRRRLDAQEKDT